MSMLPSRRLLFLSGAALLAALGMVVFPRAWTLLLTVDLLLVLLALVDWLITPGPARLSVGRSLPERMSVQADSLVVVTVLNQASVKLRLVVRDSTPRDMLVVQPPSENVVAPDEIGRFAYTVQPHARGRFHWSEVQLRYQSLLGLWLRQKRVPLAGTTHVYPNLSALHRYFLLAKANRLDSLGLRQVRVRGRSWEFESLREYAFGDDTRLLDWKATARRRKPIVRNVVAERNQTLILLVDSGRLMNAEVDGLAKLDHAINTTLTLAHIALSRGDRVGLCTFSRTVHSWVPPRGQLPHLKLLSSNLYDLRGDFSETDHANCLRTLAAYHSKRALLVVLTDFVDAETAADMIAHLQLAARRHLVLFVGLKDPDVEEVARSRPELLVEGFRKSAAIELLHERRTVFEQLRRQGIQVIDAHPGQVTPPLLNRYLEIATQGLV